MERGQSGTPSSALLRSLVEARSHQHLAEALLDHLPAAGMRVIDADGSVVTEAGDPGDGAPIVALPGGRAWLEVRRAVPLEAGEPIASEATLSVIAATFGRLVAEEALRTGRAHWAHIQEMAGMGDFAWDLRRDHVTLSDSLSRIHGRTPDPTPVPYPDFIATIHPEDLEQVKQGHLYAMASGEPYFMSERIVGPDGDLRLLDTSGVIVTDAAGTPIRMVGVSVDVTGRSRIEDALRRSVAQRDTIAEDSAGVEVRLQDARLRRRHAVEINDNIIQGLAAAAMAIEVGDDRGAGGHLQRTLDAARGMMANLLAPLDGADLDPLELIRDRPAPAHDDRRLDDGSVTHDVIAAGGVRVLLVDDAEDLRLLFRYTLQRDGGFTVVGEAADGLEAITRAEELQPDVILLDVAMPRLDGFGALPRILAVAPEAVVIMLSGFGADQMADRAREAGAADYLEKGAGTVDIVEVISRHLPGAADG